jgi:hypothetical protein
MKLAVAMVAISVSALAEDFRLSGPPIPMECGLASNEGFVEPNSEEKASRLCKSIYDVKVKNSAGKKTELFAKATTSPKVRIEIVSFGTEKKDPVHYVSGGVAMPIQQNVDTINFRIVVGETVIDKPGLTWGSYKSELTDWTTTNYSRILQ